MAKVTISLSEKEFRELLRLSSDSGMSISQVAKRIFSDSISSKKRKHKNKYEEFSKAGKNKTCGTSCASLAAFFLKNPE